MSNPIKNYIDLTDLADFLIDKKHNLFALDNHSMQVIEEVAFLCANENFISDINNIRKQLIKKSPKLSIPRGTSYKSEQVLRFIYIHQYKLYKKSVENIIEKYKLLPELYWQDKFFMLDSSIDSKISNKKSFGEKINKKEIRLNVTEEALDDINLDLIDNIIILNKPFDKYDGYPLWANPYFTRKANKIGNTTIKIKKEGIPSLEIGFPAYATLPEMQAILKQSYKKIQEYRASKLPVPAKRDHRKDNLPKMIDAYMLNAKGEDKTTIAVFLDDKYDDNLSFEAVAQLIIRMKKETNRFNRQKQES